MSKVAAVASAPALGRTTVSVIGLAPSSSSSSSTSTACSRAPAGRRTAPRRRARRSHPPARPAPGTRWRGAGRLLGRGARGVVEASALDLTHGQRPEPVDERVLVPAVGQGRLGAGPQLRRGDRLVGEHRSVPCAATRADRWARRGEPDEARRPAAPRSASPRTCCAAGRSTAPRCPGRAAARIHVQQPLDQVVVVVVGLQQLAPQRRAGLAGTSGSSGRVGTRSHEAVIPAASSARRRRPPYASAGRCTAASSPPR